MTREAFLLALQTKIVHNVLATNKQKKVWKITEIDKCNKCNKQDTIILWTYEVDNSSMPSSAETEQLWIEKWAFIFGKDNISVLILDHLYNLRQHNKPFTRNEFVQ